MSGSYTTNAPKAFNPAVNPFGNPAVPRIGLPGLSADNPYQTKSFNRAGWKNPGLAYWDRIRWARWASEAWAISNLNR